MFFNSLNNIVNSYILFLSLLFASFCRWCNTSFERGFLGLPLRIAAVSEVASLAVLSFPLFKFKSSCAIPSVISLDVGGNGDGNHGNCSNEQTTKTIVIITGHKWLTNNKLKSLNKVCT